MNVTGDYVESIDNIQQNLVKQVSGCVRWQQGIEAINNKENSPRFIEVGCGKVLSNLNKRIGVEFPTLSIGKPADLELLADIL